MSGVTRADLEAWTNAAGLALTADAWTRLERLLGLWQQYGRAMSLVGSTDRDSLWEHIQEGLQCVACVERVAPVDGSCCWVDVGSGGGLPGLVVAAVRPCETVLIEPRERRAAFLDLARASVAQGKGRVIRARWSVSTWQQEVLTALEPRAEAPFFVLSSRAVFSPDEWLRKASEIEFPRGMILCHVELGVETVGDRHPSVVTRGSRWSVLGFSKEDG